MTEPPAGARRGPATRTPDVFVIRVLIACDEPRAGARLRTALLGHDNVEVLGDVVSGLGAVEAIWTLRPDAVFFNIRESGPNALDFAARLDPCAGPLIVIVAGCEKQAVEAFAIRATDYLLEPVSDERLAASLDRVRNDLRVRARSCLYEEVRQLLDGVSEPRRSLNGTADERAPGGLYASRLTVRVGHRSLVVPVADVDCIRADGAYSAIHVGKRRLIARQSLDRLEARLDPACFIRLHRSSLVNLNRIVELRHPPLGALSVVLRDGTILAVSRRRRESVVRCLGPS